MSDTVRIVQPRLVMEDPHNCTDMADALTVLEAVYDPLVARDGAAFVPALAAGWDVTDDARTWTFLLRAGVRFHDGTACDAEAVIATLRRMARPDMGVTLGAPGVYAQYLAGAEFTAHDAMTVRIMLAQPMADLLDLLVYGYVVAPSSLDDPVARPCGTGPYIVDSVGPDRIAARANPDHWAGMPLYPRIEWLRMPDPSSRLAAFETGAAEVANRLPQTGPCGPDMRDYLAPTTIIYLFNAASGPLSDGRIRRALNLALDRDALVRDVLGGNGVPLHGPFSPAHRGHVPPAHTAPDREAARSLLAEAGHPGGLTIAVDCPTSLPDEAQALTAAVSDQLASIGVALDIRLIADREEYAHMVRRSEMRDMCVFDSSPLSTFRVLREKIDSRMRGSWWLGYGNAEVEALIDAAAGETDAARRDELFRQAHELLRADPPWLFCYCHTRRIGIATDAPWSMRDDGVLDVRALPQMRGGA